MAVVGLDDTDSREGMCTTYLAARIAAGIREAGGDVQRLLLVRLNPAVEHKTRGNAALAVHADVDPGRAFELARGAIERAAEVDDPNTNPGLVVADSEAVPGAVAAFARGAVRDLQDVADALALVEAHGYRHAGWGNARGTVGALAAVGAWRGLDAWTYEHVAYRDPDRRGTPREVDREAVFAAAADAYPDAWDTVDREAGEAVCVPNTPGPVLYGIRGDDPAAVRAVADAVESEPIERTALFVTNQGTDAHLREAAIGAVEDGRAYRVTGTVVEPPETREGGHVFFAVADDGTAVEAVVDGGATGEAVAGDVTAGAVDETAGRRDGGGEQRDADGDRSPATLPCVAFEPTKRFRRHVRKLRVGDRVTVCGEVKRGTLKLEKFAVRDLVRTERVTPECPDCGRSMESAGADQGYRCRDCGTSAPGRAERPIERDLEVGWYEVPPAARRHVAKPLARGGFDAPVHPER